MDEREKKEEQNKRIGWLTSIGVQLVLLFLFYFIVAWREPFPPIPEYGIELGFTTSAGAPAASSPSQPAPETNDEPDEVTEEQSSNEPAQEVEEVNVEESVQEEIIVDEVESPVQVEEVIPEESTPKEEEEQQVDSRAVMAPSETDSSESSEEPSEGEEKEQVDQRAIYGSQGTNTGEAEGANLALSGWIWDFKPIPDDQSNQSGKIVYKIVVDGDGYLVKIETVTSTVSPAVERKYRQAVEKLTFSKTADYKTAPVSSGTITFIIKSR